jgi:hypothetical protein
LAQGSVHLKTIRECGGEVRGFCAIEDDGIFPWYFRGAQLSKGDSHVQVGFTPMRLQTEEDENLPVFSTWGFRVIALLAEHRFVTGLGRSPR